MQPVEILNLEGDTRAVSAEAVGKLEAAMAGSLLRPTDKDYDESRRIWNAMIDRRPGLIARCKTAGDAAHVIRFVRDHGLLMSVRGGGHNIAGSSLTDGGVLVDLSPMNAVTVDGKTRRALVGPGARLADFDAAAQAQSLVVPTGINSTTGVAGLTLGGGFGWLSRKHGLTVDSLAGADLVTAGGETLHVSKDENPDLFWALRGGGGNFGAVTRFEFDLHPRDPQVTAGLVVFPISEARKVLRGYRDLAATSSDDLTVWAVLRHAPPLPFLPEPVHGTLILALAVCHAGTPAAAEKEIAPFRGLGKAVGEHLGPAPYTAWQQTFDPLLTPGARNYWKSHNFAEISDGMIDVLIDSAGTIPDPQCELFLGQLGGAASRVPVEATAYAHRPANFVVNVHARWTLPEDDGKVITWARKVFDDLTPHAMGSVYVNFMTAEEAGRVKAAYGPNYERLARIKQQYDPGNVFRVNQNIRPA